MTEFKSRFSDKLEGMLSLRVTRGYKRETHSRGLARFDRFCAGTFPQADTLSREIVHAWLGSESKDARNLSASASAIRQLGKYLNSMGEEAYVLPDKFTPNKGKFVPYIFTDSELAALFAAIDSLPPDSMEPFLTEIAPVLFRLIYTCGLRPGEGRELLTENIDFDTGEILIAHAKHNKERKVVMSDDMLALCREYEKKRVIFGNGSRHFFPSSSGQAICSAKLLSTLAKAWTGAACSANNPIPHSIRVYDLRHRFASERLVRWLDEGQDLMRMLAYLRTYMGHGRLSETAYYIHILPENLVKSSAIDWGVFSAILPEVTR